MPKRRQSQDTDEEAARTPRMRGLRALPLCAPDDVGLDPQVLEDHRNRTKWQLSMGIAPGVAECVIARDRVAYLDVQGSADLERGTKMSSKTLFRCFSMTKPITAVAVMRLVEERKISLDDPVAKYIPSFRHTKVVRRQAVKKWGVGPDTPEHLEPLERPMTIRHLLTHTSGLAYGPGRFSREEELKISCPEEESYRPLVESVDNGEIATLAVFCDALASLPLRFQPGTQYLYSHGVDVAGRVIEVVAGMPLDVFLRRSVLQPVGMTRTTFSITRRQADDLAAMYQAEPKEEAEKKRRRSSRGPEKAPEEEGQKPFKVKLVRGDGERPEDSAWYGRVRVLAGGGVVGSCAGGLVSCLEDVALFCHMLLNGGATVSGGRVLRRATVRSLWRDWLKLRSVVGPAVNRDSKLPGWGLGRSLGWSPLGHVRSKDNCLFMGGWSTSWAVYPKWRIATVSLSQSTFWFDVPAWDARRDELDSVIETFQKKSLRTERRRARAAALRASQEGHDSDQEKKPLLKHWRWPRKVHLKASKTPPRQKELSTPADQLISQVLQGEGAPRSPQKAMKAPRLSDVSTASSKKARH